MKKFSIILIIILLIILMCPAVDASADASEAFEYCEYNGETGIEQYKTLKHSTSSVFSSRERREYDGEPYVLNGHLTL